MKSVSVSNQTIPGDKPKCDNPNCTCDNCTCGSNCTCKNCRN